MNRKLLDMDYKICFYPKTGDLAGQRHELHRYQDGTFHAGESKDKVRAYDTEPQLRQAVALDIRKKVRVSHARKKSSPSLVNQESLVFERR